MWRMPIGAPCTIHNHCVCNKSTFYTKSCLGNLWWPTSVEKLSTILRQLSHLLRQNQGEKIHGGYYQTNVRIQFKFLEKEQKIWRVMIIFHSILCFLLLYISSFWKIKTYQFFHTITVSILCYIILFILSIILLPAGL